MRRDVTRLRGPVVRSFTRGGRSLR